MYIKIPKYLIFSFLNIVMLISCNRKNENVYSYILEDLSSNSYYIPIEIKKENSIYEIVIPNDKLYYILSEEVGNDFDLDTYKKIMKPIMQYGSHLIVSNNQFDEFSPYILPADWSQQVYESSKLFHNNIQKAEIDNELILIKQLFESKYIVYKDDETGLLVRKEISRLVVE